MVNNQISLENPTDPITAGSEYAVYENAYILCDIYTSESSIFENSWTQKGDAQGGSIISIHFKSGVIYDANAPISVSFYYKSNKYVDLYLCDRNGVHVNQSMEILQSTNDQWQLVSLDITQFLIEHNINFSLLDLLQIMVVFDNDGDTSRYGRIKDIKIQYQTEFAGQVGGEVQQISYLTGLSCSQNKSYNLIIASDEPWHFEKLERPWLPDTYTLADCGMTLFPDSGDIGLTNVTLTVPSISSGLMQYAGVYLINLQKNYSNSIFKISMDYAATSMSWFELNGIAYPSGDYYANKNGEEVLCKFNSCSAEGWKTNYLQISRFNENHSYHIFEDSGSFDFNESEYEDFLDEQGDWILMSPIENNNSCLDQSISLTLEPNDSPSTRYLYLSIFLYANGIYEGYREISIIQEPINPLFKPINVVATPQSYQVDLTWEDDPNNTNTLGFKIKKVINSQWVEIADVSANTLSYSDTNLEASTPYEYGIGAYNELGESWVTTVEITTLAPPYNFLTNLIGYYDLEETSGGVLTKVGSFNGTVYGTPTRNQTGKHNKCYKFTGNNAINLGDNSYRLTSDYTVSMWFKPNSLPAAGCCLFTRYFSSAGYRCYNFAINAANALYMNIYRPDNTLHQTITSSGIISINNWYHVVFTKNGVNTKIFLNNSLVASKSDAPLTLRDQVGSGSNLKAYIAAIAKSNTIPDLFFIGFIDEVAIWNTGLSDDYIHELWNDGAGIFYDDF